MYNYDGLYQLLEKNNLKKSDLTKELNISSKTIAKFSRGEKVADSVVNKICAYFICEQSDIYTTSSNPILDLLKEEKDHSISGGLYHELQIRMTYNSNHIEGSSLDEDQTRRIFETNTIDSHDNLPVDDIIETVNHFRAIDYCIDVANDTLSEDIIKHIHFLLKTHTKDETLAWFRVGDYKERANVVGGKKTTPPSLVSKEMKKLLKKYNSIKSVDIKDIVEFHYEFESIHPFQDGNGRVGRLIAFKECLKHNIIPFIIEDRKKYFYYRGLQEWDTEPGFLIDTCLDGQDTFKKLLELFDL